MKLYSGIDLHSTNCYLTIIDEGGKRVFTEKLSYTWGKLFHFVCMHRTFTVIFITVTTVTINPNVRQS